MGGFFERLTKPSPEAQRLIDLQKQQLEQKGAAFREQITAARDASVARMNVEHQARIAPIQQQIDERKREMADMGRRALLGSHCSRIMVALLNPLTRALRKDGASDIRSAMRAIHDDIEQHIEAFKQQPTDEALTIFEHWAVERAGEESERVRSEFKAFRERLAADGITLG